MPRPCWSWATPTSSSRAVNAPLIQVCPDGHWGANLLRGFAAACSQTALDSALSEVLLERKKANGKALPFEVVR